jgi:hypothetical protein
LSFSKDILFATYSTSDTSRLLVSEGPVAISLLDPLEFVDAGLDVIERHVRASFALLGQVHVFVILVVFVDHSLEEAAFGGEAHALDI